jgi:hypothetical protein
LAIVHRTLIIALAADAPPMQRHGLNIAALFRAKSARFCSSAAPRCNNSFAK